MYTITIPKKEIPEQSFIMFNPREEMESVIKDNLGYDMSNAFRELIYDLTFDTPEGDDYEKLQTVITKCYLMFGTNLRRLFTPNVLTENDWKDCAKT